MEELRTAEAIRREIYDEARRKAQRIGREAEEAAARARAAALAAGEAAAAEILAEGAAAAARIRAEGLARIPLEKLRLRTDFLDRSLKAAFADYLAGLGAQGRAELVAALLRRAGAALGLSGAGPEDKGEARLRVSGFAEAEARAMVAAALPGLRILSAEPDGGLPGEGLLLELGGGRVRLRATMDLLEERLLEGRRAELAAALWPGPGQS